MTGSSKSVNRKWRLFSVMIVHVGAGRLFVFFFPVAASDASFDVPGMDASAVEEVPAFSSAPIILVAGHLKLICTIANVSLPLEVLERAPSSLCHNSSLGMGTLLGLRK